MSDGWELDELAGDLVRLRAPKLADLDAFDAFRDSDGERRWGQTELPRSPELSRAWLEELVNRKREDDTAFLVVESSEGVPPEARLRGRGNATPRAVHAGQVSRKVMVGMLREEFEVAHGF
jgi:hypothetical protein